MPETGIASGMALYFAVIVPVSVDHPNSPKTCTFIGESRLAIHFYIMLLDKYCGFWILLDSVLIYIFSSGKSFLRIREGGGPGTSASRRGRGASSAGFGILKRRGAGRISCRLRWPVLNRLAQRRGCNARPFQRVRITLENGSLSVSVEPGGTCKLRSRTMPCTSIGLPFR